MESTKAKWERKMIENEKEKSRKEQQARKRKEKRKEKGEDGGGLTLDCERASASFAQQRFAGSLRLFIRASRFSFAASEPRNQLAGPLLPVM